MPTHEFGVGRTRSMPSVASAPIHVYHLDSLMSTTRPAHSQASSMRPVVHDNPPEFRTLGGNASSHRSRRGAKRGASGSVLPMLDAPELVLATVTTDALLTQSNLARFLHHRAPTSCSPPTRPPGSPTSHCSSNTAPIQHRSDPDCRERVRLNHVR